MFTRMSGLCLVLGVIAGYAMAGPSVTAQSSPASPVPPFVTTGDDVTLQFARGTYGENPHSIRCSVAAIEGVWLRCGQTDGFGSQREQRWLNLTRVVQITKRDR